jgi:hypothetical protein
MDALLRFSRGAGMVAYAVSNSIAKGSRRARAALLPLAPAVLAAGEGAPPALAGGGAGGGGGAQLAGRQSLALQQQQQLREVEAGQGGGGGGGRDLLHALLAGYSHILQQAVAGVQLGRPMRSGAAALGSALVQVSPSTLLPSPPKRHAAGVPHSG